MILILSLFLFYLRTWSRLARSQKVRWFVLQFLLTSLQIFPLLKFLLSISGQCSFLYCRGRESGLSIPGEDTSRLNAPSIRSSSSILFESFLLISEQRFDRKTCLTVNQVLKRADCPKIRSRLSLPKTIPETH